MTFFDTLKDANVKAIFRELAWDRYRDGRSLDQIMEQMTYSERCDLFVLTHKIMKALGVPGWKEPMLLNRYVEGAQILQRSTRPDND